MWIQNELQGLREKGLYRATRLIEGQQSSRVRIAGKEVVLLCSNNYLGLADHPALVAAAVKATAQFGTSSGASRLVSGNMALHEQLESATAGFKGTEAAIVFNSGYAANTGIIPALVGRGDVVFSDRLNHASIIDGIQLSGARLVRYRHNDTDDLARLMELHCGGRRSLIVTDGVFSMDGDVALLHDLVRLKNEFGSMLMVDDAHGSGVLGDHGRGTAAFMGVSDGVDIHMGTFGKALGSFGAYAGISAEIRELLLNRARSLIFSTSLPPAVLAASLEALNLVQAEEGDTLRRRLTDNTALFRARLTNAGLAIVPGNSQIVPLITGDAETTMGFSDDLLQAGIFAQGIRPPTVPAGSCRLRFTLMATHAADDLEWSCDTIIAIARRRALI